MRKYNITLMYTDSNNHNFTFSYFVHAHTQNEALGIVFETKHNFMNQTNNIFTPDIAIKCIKRYNPATRHEHNTYKVTITTDELEEYTYYIKAFGPIEASTIAERKWKQTYNIKSRYRVHVRRILYK